MTYLTFCVVGKRLLIFAGGCICNERGCVLGKCDHIVVIISIVKNFSPHLLCFPCFIQYICNLYAEHVKEQDGILSRNTRVIIEVIIPSFSVLALLAVTAYITSDAIATISHPQSGDNGNLIIFMYAFASGNMLVDIISILMFYLRGKSGFLSAFRHINNEEDDSKSTPSENIMITSNLNMVSALTHLGSDSLRTSAVFIAAVLSSIFHLNPDHCDAWAALVVSFTIAMACVPLCREICIARRECREGEYLRLVEV
ncbi:hypothetical protein EON65_31130 [archaeon]|nr:MAG: hypothetical protein EON65_31130 [archaeon]